MVCIVDYERRRESAGSLVGLFLLLLSVPACGDRFTATAEALTVAGAGAQSETPPQGGAGAGGTAGAVSALTAGMSSGEAGDRGVGGNAGSFAGSGSGGSGGDGACLADWEGSSCDTCSSSASSATGRTCVAVLDCYVANDCTPAKCSASCDYGTATADAQVSAARRVFECRCGAVK
jgi:hypothetical protein